ncbi:MAG: hypothetical protein WBG92_25290 [Thiohalocapsa sp.]
MASNRRKQRKRTSQSDKPERRRPGSVGGWFVLGFWVVTLALLVATAFSFQSQMAQKGYAHVSLIWAVVLVGLVVMGIVFTARWAYARRNQAP